MKKFIVTTTINPPTEAITKFDNFLDWELIVIGDKKTPNNYKLKNGKFFSWEDQEKIHKELSDALGWNCIQRRNFGIYLAYKFGADIVALIDDDNIPYDFWGQNLLLSEEKITTNFYDLSENHISFDPIAVTNHSNLWHRGFPIQDLNNRSYPEPKKIQLNFDIQADFWNGDPDIDALCRMEYAPECNFKDQYFPFTSNKISPFNSQNTFITRKIIKDYFLFPFVGRMDDIWASFYVQSIGYKVVYNKPSVYQARNIHNLTVDFKNEILGYLNNKNILTDIVVNKNSLLKYLPGESIYAFKIYQDAIGKINE